MSATEAQIWYDLTQGYDISDSNTVPDALEVVVQREFANYSSSAFESKTKPTEDPCYWWLRNSPIYPSIAVIARKVLASPALSVYSERMFSTAGTIVSDLRSRLDPNLAEQLLFLNKNLTKFKQT